MVDTREELLARLADVRAEIAKARKRQRYGIDDFQVSRAALQDLLDEERWVLEQIARLDARSRGGTRHKIRLTRE
jgi:hypothetical protein